MSNYFLGIDLGGTNVEAALLDEQGKIFGRESFRTEVQLGQQSMIERRITRFCRKTAFVLRAAEHFCDGSMLLSATRLACR